MIKIGDTVKHLYGVLQGNKGKVLKDLGNGLFEVTFDHSPLHRFHCSETELEVLPTLPIGSQDRLPDWYPEEDVIGKLPPKCDCGGYKAFGSIPADAHSPWCSVFEKKA